MAAIEKMYGTVQQYDELYAWLGKEYPEFLGRMYDRREDWEYRDPNDIMIAHFTVPQDYVLYYNCPLQWVKDFIFEQYGGKPPPEE